jgi:hypothetical protein
LRQRDYVDIFGKELLTADSLVSPGKGYKLLQFDNYIYVTYKNELEEEEYVKRQLPSHPAGYQRSYVTLLHDKLITIDNSGNYFDPQDFLTSAYWGWSEKMANALPLDYKLPKEKH